MLADSLDLARTSPSPGSGKRLQEALEAMGWKHFGKGRGLELVKDEEGPRVYEYPLRYQKMVGLVEEHHPLAGGWPPMKVAWKRLVANLTQRSNGWRLNINFSDDADLAQGVAQAVGHKLLFHFMDKDALFVAHLGDEKMASLEAALRLGWRP